MSANAPSRWREQVLLYDYSWSFEHYIWQRLHWCSALSSLSGVTLVLRIMEPQKKNKNVAVPPLPYVNVIFFFCPSVCSLFLPDSHCVTLCSFCVSLWKLGTPNYRGLSVIMYLAAEMYWRTVPPWKKKRELPTLIEGHYCWDQFTCFWQW